MDISFHYFAVKTLALEAGFSDPDAQIIAQYSQYIDDYNPTFPRRYSNVPDWIKNKEGSDIYISSPLNPMNFRPVTTGFMIPVDIPDMLTKEFQKNVISPFHFIPLKAGDHRTYPAKVTDGGDGSPISTLLLSAKTDYGRDAVIGGDKCRQALMHLGMLLHTFADTYAHQMFSGYNEQCNNMKIVGLWDHTEQNLLPGLDDYISRLLKIYEDAEGEFSDKMFEIGHMLVGHVPDWTHVTLEIAFFDKEGEIERRYKRSNPELFSQAAMEIFDFLCKCRMAADPNVQLPRTYRGAAGADDAARQALQDKFVTAFETSDISKVEDKPLECMARLVQTWGGVFPSYHYSYDCSAIFDGIVGAPKSAVRKSDGGLPENGIFENEISENRMLKGVFPEMSEDFYLFNSYADDLLIALYGSHPRE